MKAQCAHKQIQGLFGTGRLSPGKPTAAISQSDCEGGACYGYFCDFLTFLFALFNNWNLCDNWVLKRQTM